MSGTTPFGLPINTPQPLSPQGFLGQGNVLQANTTLLQPVSGTFRLWDMLWLLMMALPSATPAAAPVADLQLHENPLQSLVEALQWRVEELERKIEDLDARLGNGFGER